MLKENKTIKCFAFYDTLDSKDVRVNNPAAYTKTSYILSCFQRLGYNVEVLSASRVVGKKAKRGKKRQIDNSITLKTLSSLGRGGKIKNIIGKMFFSINLIFHLLFFVKKGDILWVYHSLALIRCVEFLKKIKDFNLILEVEEIYGDILNSEKTVNKELEYFKCADAYIFCTQLLNKCANPDDKPYAVSHGSYMVKKKKDTDLKDDVIHVVYAGTLNREKGGAYTAVHTGLFLNDKYHLHILGSSSSADLNNIKELINEVSSMTKCRVTYDGAIYGEKFSEFLQKCHIGLSTQNPVGKYNDTSFPSKVLVYMANGLRVVSVRIPAIEKSDVGEFMHFYDKPDPESVAKAIKSIDFSSDYDGRKIIRELDEKFLNDLKILLKDMKNK